ncbi:MAG: hypothetical protein J7L21_04275 [Sulfurimonas sp.]|nr:hypothetical protein [Sulfurimonas sp.]
MIFNIVFFITASTYWYMTGHYLPAIIGYVVLLMFSEKLTFHTMLVASIGISSIIYYFWSDYFMYKAGDDVLQHGMGIIYMLLLYIKAKKIFDWDELALD